MTMRVLHCIHSLSGGGAEKQLTLLANNCQKADLNFAIFCVDPSGSELAGGDTNLYVIKDRANYPWKMVGEIESVIDQYQPDILHCWLPPTLVVPGLVAAGKKGVRTVVSFRAARAFYTIKDIAEYLMSKFLANAVASNNPPDQSNIFFRNLYYSKIHAQIPNAVSVPQEFIECRSKRKRNDEFTLLFVGRLIDAKNWLTLLEAVAQLSTHKPWKLMICGTGDDEKVKEAINQLGLASSVSLLGFRSDVYQVMAESDLLVLPSWREGMPNVPLEALAMGLPCVVSSIVAHTAVFSEHSGVEFFDPGGVAELSSLLNKYINDEKDLQAMEENGKAFSSEFTPDVLVTKYRALYNAVINEK